MATLPTDALSVAAYTPDEDNFYNILSRISGSLQAPKLADAYTPTPEGDDSLSAMRDYYGANMSMLNDPAVSITEPVAATQAPTQNKSLTNMLFGGGGGLGGVLPTLGAALAMGALSKSGSGGGKKDWLTGLTFGGGNNQAGLQFMQQMIGQRQEREAALEKAHLEAEGKINLERAKAEAAQAEETRKAVLDGIVGGYFKPNDPELENFLNGDYTAITRMEVTPKLEGLKNRMGSELFLRAAEDPAAMDNMSEFELALLSQYIDILSPKDKQKFKNLQTLAQQKLDAAAEQNELNRQNKITTTNIAQAGANARTAANIKAAWAREQFRQGKIDARQLKLIEDRAKKEDEKAKGKPPATLTVKLNDGTPVAVVKTPISKNQRETRWLTPEGDIVIATVGVGNRPGFVRKMTRAESVAETAKPGMMQTIKNLLSSLSPESGADDSAYDLTDEEIRGLVEDDPDLLPPE